MLRNFDFFMHDLKITLPSEFFTDSTTRSHVRRLREIISFYYLLCSQLGAFFYSLVVILSQG